MIVAISTTTSTTVTSTTVTSTIASTTTTKPPTSTTSTNTSTITSTTESPTTPSFTCPSSDGFFAIPNTCSANFYTCMAGIPYLTASHCFYIFFLTPEDFFLTLELGKLNPIKSKYFLHLTFFSWYMLVDVSRRCNF